MTQPNAPISPDDDLRIARDALEAGDLRHAMHHAAWALHAAPYRSEARALLNEIIQRAPAPRDLLPPLQGAAISAAEAAVHAELLARAGQYDVAFAALREITSALPDTRYVVWATGWLLDAKAKGAPIDQDNLASYAAALGGKHRGDFIPNEDERDRLAAFTRAVDGLLDAAGASARLLLMQSLLLRKVGRDEDALLKAQAALAAEPTNAFAHVAAAMAQRKLGQIDAALRSYQQALIHDPKYIEVYNDIGDLNAERGRIDAAAAAYGAVLNAQPEHHWAAPSYYFYQAQLDSNPDWLRKLTDFAAQFPDNERAADLLRRIHPHGVMFVDFLPEPAEASLHVLKQFLQQHPDSGQRPPNPDGRFNLGLSALEAPSAMLALRMGIESVMPGVVPTVSVAQLQRPDPRAPRSAAGGLELWTYSGTDAAPKMPGAAPAEAAALWTAVVSIAITPYHLMTWADAAQRIGGQMGEGSIDGLLHAMVTPPPPAPPFTPWDWIYRFQVAAALIIAGTSVDWDRPTAKKGLFGKNSEEAPRKRMLYGLLFGQMDWTIDAAIIALYAIAQREPQHEREIARWLTDAYFRQHPRPGYVPYMRALVTVAAGLPSVGAAVKARMLKELQ